jgi:hypothetical protein
MPEVRSRLLDEIRCNVECVLVAQAVPLTTTAAWGHGDEDLAVVLTALAAQAPRPPEA